MNMNSRASQNTFADDRSLGKAALLYYEKGLSQQEVAAHMGVSRSTVSRMLAAARERGLVEIRVDYPGENSFRLEQELVDRFGLRQAVVVRRDPDLAGLETKQVARAAADFVLDRLRDGDVLGTSWGSTLREVVENTYPERAIAVTVVQLIGSMPAPVASRPDAAANELVQRLARRLGGVAMSLPIPLLLDSAATRDAMLMDSSVARVLDLRRRISLALVGIGASDNTSALYAAGLIGNAELGRLSAAGAAGDICGRFYTLAGEPLASVMDPRLVAIELAELQALPEVLGVATGTHKAGAVLGALRGRFVTTLATDDATAEAVLRLDAQTAAGKR